MSSDMFKKMKERITDEVSSATNKLQNMQIIDQLAAGINQQTARHDTMPNQTLPVPPPLVPTNSTLAKNNNDKKCDDLIDVTASNEFNEEEEELLNSEVSPQHQLFNHKTIKPLQTNMSEDKQLGDTTSHTQHHHNNNESQQLHQTVINIEELSSDLENEAGGSINDDAEVDLLTDREIPPRNDSSRSTASIGDDRSSRMAKIQIYKMRYRNVVRALRQLNKSAAADKTRLKSEISELTGSLENLKQEFESLKRQSNNPSPMSNASKSASGRSSSKMRDLEKLIAKCKESLKQKNSQLKTLKDSLANVDKFRDSFAELKNELNEIRSAHETWTVSIAENKRIMHQEIENKNYEISRLMSDITELQLQLKDSHSKSQQLRSNIQNLESRLVNTSAAHQKERESLAKELTSVKNQAIKQVQREHELQLERVKLELEKSIEALKSEILGKDEILIKKTEREQQLEERNKSLQIEIDETKQKLDDNLKIFNELRSIHDNCSTNKIARSEEESPHEAENVKLISRVSELETHIHDLNEKLKQYDADRLELEDKLLKQQQQQQQAELKESCVDQVPKECQECIELKKGASHAADRYEQSLFDLYAQLDLMTTANADQEQALDTMRGELVATNENFKTIKLELDESAKRNESLARIIRDNETELQTQQELLDKLSNIKHDYDNLKKEHSAQAQALTNLRSDLNERNSELNLARNEIEKYKIQLSELDLKLKTLTHSFDELVKEKETLISDRMVESKLRIDFEQKLVVSILSAMKNLETPNTSPGSDKSYQQQAQTDSLSSSFSINHDDNDGDKTQHQKLPDPIGLVEKLSSLAVDRSNSYMTSNQRLQAVLLDNSMLSEELNRLREELNTVNREKTQETLCSIEEAERLRTENQALIHDQKSYDDQLSALESEIETLKEQLEEANTKQQRVVTNEVATETITAPNPLDYNEMLSSNEREIVALKELVERQEKQLQMLREDSNDNIKEIPDSTQFEYLKNIVYQFMLGREPLVLARVISAVFKFEQSQIEQICKAQEAYQAAIRPSI